MTNYNWHALAKELSVAIDDLMWYLSTRNVSGNDVWTYFIPILKREDVSELLKGREHNASMKDEIEAKFNRRTE